MKNKNKTVIETENLSDKMSRLGIKDEPGNKVVSDIWDDDAGIEVRWQCDKKNCNCVGSWREKH